MLSSIPIRIALQVVGSFLSWLELVWLELGWLELFDACS